MYELEPEQAGIIQEAIEDQGGKFRGDYSGRGMYGSRCIGFDVGSIKLAVQAIVQIAERDPDLAQDLAGAWTQDQMGLGMIVYFPGFEVEDQAVAANVRAVADLRR